MPAVRDFSQYEAIVVSVVLKEKPEPSIIALAAVDYKQLPHGLRAHLDVLDLHESQGRFEDILREGQRIVTNPDFFLQESQNRTYLVVDMTEAPESLMDIVWSMENVVVENIVITAEQTTHRHSGRMFVPLKNMAAALIDSFDSGLIDVAGGLELAETLEAELGNFTIRSASEASSVALGTALLCWKAAEENYDLGYSQSADIDWQNQGLG